MHDGGRSGLQVGELFQVLRGQWSVRDTLRKDARLIFLHRLMRAAHDIGRGERLDVAILMEQIRAEQRPSSEADEGSGSSEIGTSPLQKSPCQ